MQPRDRLLHSASLTWSVQSCRKLQTSSKCKICNGVEGQGLVRSVGVGKKPGGMGAREVESRLKGYGDPKQ